MLQKIKYINALAILIPILLAIAGFIDEDYFIYALLSTMLTGFLQIVAGLMFWYLFPDNKFVMLYFIFVVLFFTVWLATGFENVLFYCPPVLCIYLSVIIYSKKITHEF